MSQEAAQRALAAAPGAVLGSSSDPAAHLGACILDALPASVLVTEARLDPPGPRILYANPAFERLTGWSRAEIVGQTPRVLQGAETDRRLFADMKRRLGDREIWSGETVNYRRDGTAFQMAWSIAPLADPSGAIVGYAAVQSDVTQARTLQLSLLQAQQGAKEASAAKSRFLATMSHELRTPLNAINGFSELLEAQLGGSDPTLAAYARHVRDSGTHLLGIVERLLDVSRIETGRLEVAPRAVSARTLLEESATLLTHAAERRGIRLEVQAEETQLFVDPQLMRQVVVNLASNAIAVSPDGATVSLSGAPVPDGGHRIAIRDRGPGLPEEHVDRLLQPFERGQAHAACGDGLGLGLHLAASYLRAHGGALAFETPGDGGTRAQAWLPPTCVVP